MPPGWENVGDSELTAIPSSAQGNLAGAVTVRDPSCRISDYRDCTTCSHLCPRAELDWFTSNSMGRYNLQTQPTGLYIIDDIRNAIALRYDLHMDFDKRKFVCVPKSNSMLRGAMVTHVLQPTNELGLLYHNVQMHPTPGVPHEFWLARFAWAIFPSVQPFLDCGIPRLLIRIKTTADGQRSLQTEQVDGAGCRSLAGIPSRTPSPSKQSSPKKRRPISDPADERNPCSKRRRLDSSASESTEASSLDGLTQVSPSSTSHSDISSMATNSDDEPESPHSNDGDDSSRYSYKRGTKGEDLRSGKLHSDNVGGDLSKGIAKYEWTDDGVRRSVEIGWDDGDCWPPVAERGRRRYR
jgi:hypothetical protein